MKHPNAPDPSPDCPRCHYWQLNAEVSLARAGTSEWPMGIDQHKALEILTAAFPDSYGKKRKS